MYKYAYFFLFYANFLKKTLDKMQKYDIILNNYAEQTNLN